MASFLSIIEMTVIGACLLHSIYVEMAAYFDMHDHTINVNTPQELLSCCLLLCMGLYVQGPSCSLMFATLFLRSKNWLK